MFLRDEVLRRLLVAKHLLLAASDPVTPHADPVAVARMILTAHDASDLTIAAIADQIGVPGLSDQLYLLNYISKIEQHVPTKSLPGARFFKTLNSARRAFKHEGLLPDARDWYRVIENTWNYLDHCCFQYLDTPFDDIDLTALLANPGVKEMCLQARALNQEGKAKEALEYIGQALFLVLNSLPGFHRPTLGERDPHQAMMLTAYGIRASDFLSLQEFVPKISIRREDSELTIHWETRETGHPANWTTRNAAFCLDTVVDLALKTQHAPWHPSPIHFGIAYRDVITAVRDNVLIWRYKPTPGFPLLESEELVEVMRLNRGQRLRGMLTVPSKQRSGGYAEILGPKPTIETAEILAIFTDDDKFGYLNRVDFEVSYEAKDTEMVRKHFPHIFEAPSQ